MHLMHTYVQSLHNMRLGLLQAGLITPSNKAPCEYASNPILVHDSPAAGPAIGHSLWLLL